MATRNGQLAYLMSIASRGKMPDSSKLQACPAVSLDETRFRVRIVAFALSVEPKLTQTARISLREQLLELPRYPVLVKPEPPSTGLLLLLKHVKAVEGNDALPLGNVTVVQEDARQICERLRAALEADHGLKPKQLKKLDPEAREKLANMLAQDQHVIEHTIELDYQYWGHDVVLKELLPREELCPSSYETVGHLLHLNLRDEQLPHKWLIGKVLLDKVPGAKTVVNKVEPTGGPFRVFQMELLAGEDNYEAHVRENGCTFEMDFSKVYWNSRLETEHRRIVDSLSEKDVLADAFGGIGPFVVPAAKIKRCRTYGNDLNPSSIKYMQLNAKANKVEKLVTTSCEDARDFLKRLIADKVPVTRVIMNFPSGAPEFLDLYQGAYIGAEQLPLPTVSCYCFAPIDEPEQEAIPRVKRALFGDADNEFEASCRFVRGVSPKKVHVCVTFKVPAKVAYVARGESAVKRPRLDDSSDEVKP